MSFNRRSVLKLSAAGLAAPMVLNASNALASSGNVKVLVWGDCIQPNIAEAFENESVIKRELTTFGSNDEAESTIRANRRHGVRYRIPVHHQLCRIS
ncbi:hypothetical protein [Sulfitobacter sp.]|uniref:hypothetical protein n=1 Tax=Sulfitobacter sp. TaxID=1903071 RepID=UPI00300276EF